MNYLDVTRELGKLADAERAKVSARFFKTAKGQYGYGDVFIGITVPKLRLISRDFNTINLTELQKLLKSRIHEHRLIALLILVNRFNKGRGEECEKIVKFYIRNIKFVNNWDLVDLSAPYIVGKYFFDKNRDILYRLAKSKNMWERRISIVSTFYFIRHNDFKNTLDISRILLVDKCDLIHKAVGWMLREVGKRDEKILTEFLNKNTREMPRTTLRYAIERFDNGKRQRFLNKI